jgi:hypothetical protein
VLYRIPIGRPRYEAPDEDGFRYLTNSVGNLMHDVFGWFLCADITFARSLYRFAVSEDVVRQLGATEE